MFLFFNTPPQFYGCKPVEIYLLKSLRKHSTIYNPIFTEKFFENAFLTDCGSSIWVVLCQFIRTWRHIGDGAAG